METPRNESDTGQSTKSSPLLISMDLSPFNHLIHHLRWSDDFLENGRLAGAK
jgi:hypothetical protein